MNPWGNWPLFLPLFKVEFRVLRVNSESASCKEVSREVPWIKLVVLHMTSCQLRFCSSASMKAGHCGLYKHIPCLFHESGCLEVVYRWHWEENEAICLFLFHEMKSMCWVEGITEKTNAEKCVKEWCQWQSQFTIYSIYAVPFFLHNQGLNSVWKPHYHL